jgi:hypothetical protein
MEKNELMELIKLTVPTMVAQVHRDFTFAPR